MQLAPPVAVPPAAVENCTEAAPLLPPERVTVIEVVPAASPALKVAELNCRNDGAVTTRQAENSEVLLFGSVAVAVMNWPAESEVGKLKLALQLALVVTVIEPMNVCPSPLPEGSQEVLAKNWMVNVVPAVLFSVPWTDVVEAEVKTGKFCRLFAPVSASHASLAVTPLSPRSIPNPVFE